MGHNFESVVKHKSANSQINKTMMKTALFAILLTVCSTAHASRFGLFRVGPTIGKIRARSREFGQALRTRSQEFDYALDIDTKA